MNTWLATRPWRPDHSTQALRSVMNPVVAAISTCRAATLGTTAVNQVARHR